MLEDVVIEIRRDFNRIGADYGNYLARTSQRSSGRDRGGDIQRGVQQYGAGTGIPDAEPLVKPPCGVPRLPCSPSPNSSENIRPRRSQTATLWTRRSGKLARITLSTSPVVGITPGVARGRRVPCSLAVYGQHTAADRILDDRQGSG